jgi:ABC-type uncharacterized transport system permease subunit
MSLHPLSQIGGILKQAMQAVIGLAIWFVIMEIMTTNIRRENYHHAHPTQCYPAVIQTIY